jgi:hypothetical protein
VGEPPDSESSWYKVCLLIAGLTQHTNDTQPYKGESLVTGLMQKYKFGCVTQTLNIEHDWQRKGTRVKKCQVYMQWFRVSSLVQ